jgi:hypothetical protein
MGTLIIKSPNGDFFAHCHALRYEPVATSTGAVEGLPDYYESLKVGFRATPSTDLRPVH